MHQVQQQGRELAEPDRPSENRSRALKPLDAGSAIRVRRPDLYDRIYHWKDYRREASWVHACLAATGVPSGAGLLEAACGTGNYLVHLASHYRCAGFDADDGLLDIARSKLPGISLVNGDLRDFRVSQAVDALICLFGAIGYVHGNEALAHSASCMYSALHPGGVALVEAWHTPDDIASQGQSVQVWRGREAGETIEMDVVRTSVTKVVGSRSILEDDWLVVTPGGTDHFTERHELWLFARQEYLGAFSRAGFSVTWLDDCFPFGRGLILARRLR